MPLENRYYVYLLTNWNHRVMYVGVTDDLVRRLYEHKNKLFQRIHEEVQREQACLLRGDQGCA